MDKPEKSEMVVEFDGGDCFWYLYPEGRIDGYSYDGSFISTVTAEAILAGLKAGLGKSLLPAAIGARDPALKRLGDGPPGLTREIWLMLHPDLKDLVRIKVVTAWLTATVRRLVAPDRESV